METLIISSIDPKSGKMVERRVPAKFHPGDLAVTPGAFRKMNGTYALTAFLQHLKGQWGLVDEEDWALNDRALKEGDRVLSKWPLPNDPGCFYIVTEADRSSTTILLPEEY